MIPEKLLQHILAKLSEIYGPVIRESKISPLTGGCINESYRLDTGNASFFLKYNRAFAYPGMFEAEAKGLSLLASVAALPVPEVIFATSVDNYTAVVMKFISSGRQVPDFWEVFGSSLAALHRNSADFFGLDHDNYIGSLPQVNTKHSDWIEFFVTERLERQLRLAVDDDRLGTSDSRQFESLYKSLPEIIPVEKPALLHGDLWGGNYLINHDGLPCIMDPAVYYGHREMDLGMTRLFGGFDKQFYQAYNQAYPLEKGWLDRQDIFNLYPLLVHVNLFGGGYASSVRQIVRRF